MGSNSVCYIVGLMSGTSLDGVDAALVKISEHNNEITMEAEHFSVLSFSAGVKEKIMKLCVPETSEIADISAMNMLLGELFADAALQVIDEKGFSAEDILLISSHGQTIYHQPNSVTMEGKDITSTLQIGDIGVIAERTGIPTVGDFRTRDMAAGGQGAPLVPYADHMIFKDKEIGRVLVNIGGISNITVLPKDCRESGVFAYDTGPGNMVIDAFTGWATNHKQSYDKDGSIAAKGKVNEKWLDKLLQHDYFQAVPPKSTGREMFGIDFARNLWQEADRLQLSKVDKLATVTELTAKSLALEINRQIAQNDLSEIVISGGGCSNKTLMKHIASHLPNEITIRGTEEYGISADAKEAIAFALLGYQCYYKKTNNLPSATGAKNKVIMGKMAW